MRCLTLAEELAIRGHEVQLATGAIEIAWLDETVRSANLTVQEAEPEGLSLGQIRDLDPDWLVVDSYQIPAGLISAAAREMPVLAIVDGDERSIDASLYLDQNLGAESIARRPETAGRYLAGADYALVRRAVLDARRSEPWHIHGDRPNVLCFMGGADSTGSVVELARALAALPQPFELTIVAPVAHHADLRVALANRNDRRILAPTPGLPALMAAADVIISAAGTSAWDICTLGIPAVLIAVVDNQRASLHEAVNRGLALGLDAVDRPIEALRGVGPLVGRLLDDQAVRKQLSLAARATFDGCGASRVADRLEAGTVPDSGSVAR